MTQWHMKSKRKPSGGLRHTIYRCTKKLAWKGRNPTETYIAEDDERELLRGRGGNKKVVLTAAKNANVVVDRKANEMKKMQILKVVDNKARRDYIRRNVITKGAIIEVQGEGEEPIRAIVTSRPGQSGTVQATVVRPAKEAG